MRDIFSKEKIDYMINSKFFNYFTVPVMAFFCLFLSVLFYGFIDESFAITYYQNKASDDLMNHFFSLMLDKSIKFALSTLFFFFIYILHLLAAMLFISKRNIVEQ